MSFTKTIINAIQHWVNNKLNNYVEIVEGKGLSTEDYTTEEKEKLATINEMPETSDSYMQLVTDADGNAVWEDRLAYEHETELMSETELTVKTSGSGSTSGLYVEFILSEPINYGETMVVCVDDKRYEGIVVDADTAQNKYPDVDMGWFFPAVYNVTTAIKPAYTAAGMPTEEVEENLTWGLRSEDGQTWRITTSYRSALDTGASMRVAAYRTEVKKIDSKWLPQPYVIDIGTNDTGDYVTTASVEDAIDAYKTGREVVFEVDGYPRINASDYWEDEYTKEIYGQLLAGYEPELIEYNVAIIYNGSETIADFYEREIVAPYVIEIKRHDENLTTTASVDNAFAAHKAGREVVFVYGTERMIATQFIDNNVFKLIGGNTIIDDGVNRNFVSYAVLQSGNMTQVHHEIANLMEALTLASPNGTRYRLTVTDDGTWSYVSEGEQDDSPVEKLVKFSDLAPSDWTQTDENAIDYIKNKPYEETSDDALDLLAEMGVLEATTNEEGFILTDENNNILTI